MCLMCVLLEGRNGSLVPGALLLMSLLNKRVRPGWPYGMRLPHPPLHFFSIKPSFICQKFTPAIRLDLGRDLLQVLFHVKDPDRMCCGLHNTLLGLQAARLPICRNTHILLLFNKKQIQRSVPMWRPAGAAKFQHAKVQRGVVSCEIKQQNPYQQFIESCLTGTENGSSAQNNSI